MSVSTNPSSKSDDPYDGSAEEIATLIAAVTSPLFSHARMRPWCGVNVVTIYHFDAKSPTGVMAVAGGDERTVDPIIREYQHTSALSPTEGLGQ